MPSPQFENFQNFMIDQKRGSYNPFGHCQKRIKSILKKKLIKHQAKDFLSLIRQILLSEDKNEKVSLLLNTEIINEIDLKLFSEFNLLVYEQKGFIRVEAGQYNLPWTAINGEHLDTKEFFKHDKVRRDFSIELDKHILNCLIPINEMLVENKKEKITNYYSSGQRRAFSAMLGMEQGTTLIVNLPTGAGKSLLFQLPQVLEKINGLVLVVVPTTALALDQERRFKDLSKDKDKIRVFHSGLSEVERNQVKANIRNGNQDILFASPEAVVGALVPALYRAAERGYLSYFFVDEAHIFSSWGETFRPGYQSLPVVRRGLLNKSPSDNKFKTVLLSATFSEIDIDLLDKLFEPRDKIGFFSWNYMRVEPKYYFHKVKTEEEKFNLCAELVKYFPKPMIIYTTEVKEEAVPLFQKIKLNGFKSVELFTGKTSNIDRHRIISEWALGNIDIIVATSAFGVGIDKADVRTVMHATMPETVERFYQEVGRAGRDGRCANSIIIYCQEDVKKSLSIAKGKSGDNVGEENAFQRWQIMHSERKIKNSETFLTINAFDAVPPHLNQTSNKNHFHNQITLFTMAKAGMIDLHSISPSETNIDPDFDSDQFWNNYYREIFITIKDELHLNKKNFYEKYSYYRNFLTDSREKSNQKMLEVLIGKISVEEALFQIYSSTKKDRNMQIRRVCRGCPKCLQENNGEKSIIYREPYVHEFYNIEPGAISQFKETWGKYLNEKTAIIYFSSSQLEHTNLVGLLEIALLNYDISQINLDKDFSKHLNYSEIFSYLSKQKFLFINEVEFNKKSDLKKKFLPKPTLTILSPWSNKPIPEFLEDEQENGIPFHIIVVPSSVECNTNRRKRIELEDLLPIREFLSELE